MLVNDLLLPALLAVLVGSCSFALRSACVTSVVVACVVGGCGAWFSIASVICVCA